MTLELVFGHGQELEPSCERVPFQMGRAFVEDIFFYVLIIGNCFYTEVFYDPFISFRHFLYFKWQKSDVSVFLTFFYFFFPL